MGQGEGGVPHPSAYPPLVTGQDHTRSKSGLKVEAAKPCWYDNEFEYSGHHNSINFQHQRSAPHVPMSGARSTGTNSPHVTTRKAGEESYDLHKMLKIWAESKQNPFGEGTLV